MKNSTPLHPLRPEQGVHPPPPSMGGKHQQAAAGELPQ